MIFLASCQESAPVPRQKLISGLSLLHECNVLISLGYKVDITSCVKHIDNPKYKIGQVLYMTDGVHLQSCTFTITRPLWSHGFIQNKPAYDGNISCIDKLDHLQFYAEGVSKLESELKL